MKITNTYKSTKFVRVSTTMDTMFPSFDYVFSIAIKDNKDYLKIVEWDSLRKFTKTLKVSLLPMTIFHNECPFNDGECHHCSYCYDQAGDEYEFCIPIYSYELKWKQNRRLMKAFCNAWAETDLAGVVRFIDYHRRSLNKTCGRKWTTRLLSSFRREYYSAF